VAFWPVRLAATLMRSLGLVASQTLVFLFAGIEGPAAMVQRLAVGGRAERVFQLQAEDLPAAFRRCGRWGIRCC
jgi:hypothetical protein